VNSHRSCELVFTSPQLQKRYLFYFMSPGINRSASSPLRIVMPILHRAITPPCRVLPSRGDTWHTTVD